MAVAAPKKNTFNAWQDSNDVGLLSALICCVSACAPRLLRARYLISPPVRSVVVLSNTLPTTSLTTSLSHTIALPRDSSPSSSLSPSPSHLPCPPYTHTALAHRTRAHLRRPRVYTPRRILPRQLFSRAKHHGSASRNCEPASSGATAQSCPGKTQPTDMPRGSHRGQDITDSTRWTC